MGLPGPLSPARLSPGPIAPAQRPTSQASGIRGAGRSASSWIGTCPPGPSALALEELVDDEDREPRDRQRRQAQQGEVDGFEHAPILVAGPHVNRRATA